jgi:hypothetical protein
VPTPHGKQVSNIVKQFKLSCAKAQAAAAQFDSLEVHNSQFRLFIDVFTSNTYAMVVQVCRRHPAQATPAATRPRLMPPRGRRRRRRGRRARRPRRRPRC